MEKPTTWRQGDGETNYIGTSNIETHYHGDREMEKKSTLGTGR
jgi:hypothetical protein